ncbi:MAG: hypothetical protein HC923_04875 [Myxococcales bacterium]|nr:hypothetical protein [Myxococcales bacterium]
MIPPRHRPEWSELLTGSTQHAFKFLALKLVLTRLRGRMSSDSSSQNLNSCIDELYRFACENEKFVGPDLQEVFSCS